MSRAFDVPRPAPQVLLLQTFDEYVVGYRESRRALDLAGISNMVGPGWGAEGNPAVSDSQVVGHWNRTVGRGEVLLTIALRAALPGAHREALDAAVDAYGAFLGVPAHADVTGA